MYTPLPHNYRLANYTKPPQHLHHKHTHKSNFGINGVFSLVYQCKSWQEIHRKIIIAFTKPRVYHGLFNHKKWKQRERWKLYSNTTKDNLTQCRTIVTAGAGLWTQSSKDERIFPQAISILTDSRFCLFSVFSFPFKLNKLMTK